MNTLIQYILLGYAVTPTTSFRGAAALPINISPSAH